MHCHTAWGDGESCPGGGRCLKSGTPAMHCHTHWGQWEVQLLQCTTTVPRGSGKCNSCDALPHCLGAVGRGTPVTHRLTAWGQWAVQFRQCIATPPRGGGQWTSCNARAHQLGGRGVLSKSRCLMSGTPRLHGLGAVGGAPKERNPAMHCHAAWGQWAVQLVQCTASLPGVTGQCNS